MTTTTLKVKPVLPPHPARPNLRGLAWVTWRQHRTAVLATTATLLLVGLALLWDGSRMHADYRQFGMAGCLPDLAHVAPHCASRLQAFSSDDGRAQQLTSFMLALPVLFGVFLGAPLLAREYESGSFRFSFTQGVSRARWLVTKLLLLGVFTIVATTAFTGAVAWWYGPLVQLDGRLGVAAVFEVYGPVFVARALFAFTLGVLVGALVRRVVPAMAVTLAVWVGVVALSITQVRAHLLPPLVTSAAAPARAWVLTDTWTSPNSAPLSPDQVSELEYNTARAGHKLDLFSYLTKEGYHHTLTYQPTNRFWPLQWIETGGLAVLALGCAVATVWLIRRRAT